MPYKVQLKHPHATGSLGLSRGKVVDLTAAHVFDTFKAATDTMNAWLDYSGRERRRLWTGQVVTSTASAS